jgi:hypothetical protein
MDKNRYPFYIIGTKEMEATSLTRTLKSMEEKGNHPKEKSR